jgi:hypothetical protein
VKRSTPTFHETVLALVDESLGQVCTGMPARVESYDPTTQRCSVQPLVQRVYDDASGNRVAERHPVVSDVPVCFPGAGSWRLTFPIASGDTVWLMFSQASLDLWLQRGGEVDPEDPRRHHLSDAVAYPGLRPFSHALGDASPSSMVLGNGTVQVEITDTEVQAGGTDALALAGDLAALYNAIAGAAVVAGDGGAAFKAAVLGALAGWPTAGTTVLKGS